MLYFCRPISRPLGTHTSSPSLWACREITSRFPPYSLAFSMPWESTLSFSLLFYNHLAKVVIRSVFIISANKSIIIKPWLIHCRITLQPAVVFVSQGQLTENFIIVTCMCVCQWPTLTANQLRNSYSDSGHLPVLLLLSGTTNLADCKGSLS